MAVHIRADKGYVWALSSVKAKQNTYTIRTVSILLLKAYLFF